VHILDEGIDIPECDSVYLTHPNNNPINIIQRISRSNRLDVNNKDKISRIFVWSKNQIKLDDIINRLSQYIKINYGKENNDIINNTHKLIIPNKYINNNIDNTFSCEICNKLYKSYQTLWNHNKIKHNDLIINIKQNKECKFSCNLCNKKFTRNDNLKYHKNNTCKLKTNHIIINNIEQPNNNITNNNITNNNTLNNISNSNVNNGTINIYINKTGTENVLELNECEKNKIFDKELCSIFLFIKFINFNERLPNNHSFCSKSLEGKYVL
jgi:superfamily II DNA/RNA helicase